MEKQYSYDRRVIGSRRFVFTRDFYLPEEVKGKEPIVPEGTDLAIWTYDQEKNGRKIYFVIAFVAKQSKPLVHGYYSSEQARNKYIEDIIESRKKVLSYKQERQQERKEFKHEFNVGDILYASWGYDQTNVDFYEVTEILGPQMVELRKISQGIDRAERSGGDYVVPIPGKYTSPPMRRRVTPGHVVKIDDVRRAHKWGGKSVYQTALGWGH